MRKITIKEKAMAFDLMMKGELSIYPVLPNNSTERQRQVESLAIIRQACENALRLVGDKLWKQSFKV